MFRPFRILCLLVLLAALAHVPVAQGGKVKVTLDVFNAPKGSVQPAHIHLGSCPDPGAVKYPLTSVSNGHSETMLDTSVGEILQQLPLAINVHKSVKDAKAYVACGNVVEKGYVAQQENAAMLQRAMMEQVNKGAMPGKYFLTGEEPPVPKPTKK